MLLRFEVSNFKSIFEPVEFSMMALDSERSSVRRFDALNEGVLCVAGVYGPNASGKTNLVESLAWLSFAVRSSLISFDEVIPREPFKFGNGPTSPTSYRVEMIVDGVRYEYRLELSDSRILSEALYSFPFVKRRKLFERKDMELTFRRGLKGLTGTRELMTPTTLVLSAAVRLDDEEIRPFGVALGSITQVGLRRRTSIPRVLDRYLPAVTESLFLSTNPALQASLFEDGSSTRLSERDQALELLRFADLGIDDIRVVEDGGSNSDEVPTGLRDNRRQIRFIHRIADQAMPFEWREESAGTRTWFHLLGPMLGALNRGGILLIDEVEASLHPRLSACLIELFESPDSNPKNGQLIFTTHDTSLLNFLNRDEVWFTERSKDGSTVLTALADFAGDKVRKSLNLERAYLQGRFGAVPEFDQFLLHHALGLI
jgi:hypothetical protein